MAKNCPVCLLSDVIGHDIAACNITSSYKCDLLFDIISTEIDYTSLYRDTTVSVDHVINALSDQEM